MVYCPVHKVALSIKSVSLTIFNSVYSLKVGECPVCGRQYTNRKILPSGSHLTIKGKHYTYLPSMEAEYPYSSVHTKNKEIGTKKSAHSKPKPKQKQTSKTSPVPDQLQVNPSTASQKQKNVDDIKKRILSNNYKSYHAVGTYYNEKYPSTCTKCHRELLFVDRISLSSYDNFVIASGYCCLHCRIAYLLSSEKRLHETEYKEKLVDTDSVTQTALPTDKIDFFSNQRTLYICRGSLSCQKYNHGIQSATGLLLTGKGKVEKINTNYCPKCDKYFISYEEYQHYRNKLGVILGNLKYVNSSFGVSSYNLAEESQLHLCGYSVNQNDGLSSTERRRILGFLLDRRIMSKTEILAYLNSFVKRNGKKVHMEIAVSKWNDDAEWVRNYQIDRQRQYVIGTIQKY